MLFGQIGVEQDHLESVLLAHLRSLEPSAVEVGTERAHLSDLGLTAAFRNVEVAGERRFAADAADREGDP